MTAPPEILRNERRMFCVVILLFLSFPAYAENGHIEANVVDIATITQTVDGILVQDGGDMWREEGMVGDTLMVSY